MVNRVSTAAAAKKPQIILPEHEVGVPSPAPCGRNLRVTARALCRRCCVNGLAGWRLPHSSGGNFLTVGLLCVSAKGVKLHLVRTSRRGDRAATPGVVDA